MDVRLPANLIVFLFNVVLLELQFGGAQVDQSVGFRQGYCDGEAKGRSLAKDG